MSRTFAHIIGLLRLFSVRRHQQHYPTYLQSVQNAVYLWKFSPYGLSHPRPE